MKAWACGLAAIAAGVAVYASEPGKKSAPEQRVAVVGAPEIKEITPAHLTAALLAETNRVRRQYGRHALRAQEELNAAADDQAVWMAMHLGAEHHNPFYGEHDVSERVLRHGYRPASVAENVASQPASVDGDNTSCEAIAARLVEAWMNSPGHRANLLNRNFTRLGCGARVVAGFGGTDYVFGAQVFSTNPDSDVLRF
ncbi:MAG: SCP-like extracellular [Verrucomicrobia bacterium]|nr:SCP-like extracellular [Verrucomicrobiota bacterium]